jgi:hypothetical protein
VSVREIAGAPAYGLPRKDCDEGQANSNQF